jgi:SAM-dependent methyltransferase
MTQPILTGDARPASDIDAHSARIEAYSKFANRDINSVLDDELAHFPKGKEISVLDVGCGNGKQSKYISQKFPKAKITGIDISPEAIHQLQEEQPEINGFVCDLNDANTFLKIVNKNGPTFDLIVSFYALYYAKNMENLLPVLRQALNPDGRIILTGFSSLNNKELIEITSKYAKQEIETDDFVQPWIIEKYFGNYVYKYYYFHNPIRFPDDTSFLSYYKNYGLYLKDIEEDVAKDVRKEISEKGSFTLSKVSLVVSITGQKSLAGMTCLPNPLKTDIFSSQRYKELLNRIIEIKYEVHPINELEKCIASPRDRLLLLRHDVDLTPRDACKMAQAEAELGIRSTYYFLISGGYFNILEKECRTCLKEICEMGHEIGVHFDDPGTIVEDCKIIFDLTGKKVLSLSQHNPTINGFKSIQDANLINAYDKSILEKHGFTYISDSGMKWRGTDIFGRLGAPRLYFLAHPETWFSEGCDLIELHRKIEQHEINKLKRFYNEYVEGNIEYLEKRLETDKR